MDCCTEAAPDAAAVGEDGQPIAVGEDGQPIPAAPAAPEPEPIPEVMKCHRMPLLIVCVQFNDLILWYVLKPTTRLFHGVEVPIAKGPPPAFEFNKDLPPEGEHIASNLRTIFEAILSARHFISIYFVFWWKKGAEVPYVKNYTPPPPEPEPAPVPEGAEPAVEGAPAAEGATVVDEITCISHLDRI